MLGDSVFFWETWERDCGREEDACICSESRRDEQEDEGDGSRCLFARCGVQLTTVVLSIM